MVKWMRSILAVVVNSYVVVISYSVPLPTSKLHKRDDNASNWTPSKRWNPSHLSKNIFHPTSLYDIKDHLFRQLGPSYWYRHEGAKNTDPTDDYTEVFLAHARIHRFAHRTDWTFLRALSLYRLTRLLQNFTVSEERTRDIVNLLRFIFVESEQMQDIQKVLSDYAVWNVEVLMHDAEFHTLLDAVPLLEKTIFRSMWK